MESTTSGQIIYPYHLCPYCGMPSPTTSRVCPSHNITIRALALEMEDNQYFQELAERGFDDIKKGRYTHLERRE